MTFRDSVVKKIRRKIKSFKRDRETRGNLQLAVNELVLLAKEASKESVNNVIQRYNLREILGGYDE